MAEQISNAAAAINLLGKLKSLFKAFNATALEVIEINQEWTGGVLVHRYRFRIRKPRFSRSASRDSISLAIPAELGIAEFHLDIPSVQTRPVAIPGSRLSISTHDLIGSYLDNLRDGQELSVSLRIPYSSNEVLDIKESRRGNCRVYKIKNPNGFLLRSCDITRPLFVEDPITEIKIVRGGKVVSGKSLIKIRKIFSLDFEGERLADHFPAGLSVSENNWLKVQRTEKSCELRITLDFHPYEEIELRLYYGNSD